MKALAASRPSLGYAPTRDLPKLTAGDQMGVHYNGQSQIRIGARFAYEAARLAGKDAGDVYKRQAQYRGGRSREAEEILKTGPSSDCRLQHAYTKPESLVMAHQIRRREYVPGSCTCLLYTSRCV